MEFCILESRTMFSNKQQIRFLFHLNRNCVELPPGSTTTVCKDFPWNWVSNMSITFQAYSKRPLKLCSLNNSLPQSVSVKSFDGSWERYSRVGFTSSSFRHSSVIFCMWAPQLNSCSQWRGKIDTLQVLFLWPVLDVCLGMEWNSTPEAPFFALKWRSKDQIRREAVLCRCLKIGEMSFVKTHKACILQNIAVKWDG